jgi:hypothetical protein
MSSNDGRADNVVIPESETIATATGPFRIELCFRQYVPAIDGEGLWRGGSQGRPKTIVTGLKVTRNGQEVPVVRAFYADLANLRTLEASIHNRRLRLAFSGGDAADSYTGTIDCDDNGMPMRREIHDGESPKTAFDVFERFFAPELGEDPEFTPEDVERAKAQGRGD